jgi:fructosamine-3-kinase
VVHGLVLQVDRIPADGIGAHLRSVARQDGAVADAFEKSRPGHEAGRFFATEAAGLDWIRVPGGPPVPAVLARDTGSISLQRIREVPPLTAVAHDFGRRLAALHAAGAPGFGAPPPEAPGPDGWIGDLPMRYASRGTFAEFWALDRIAATARLARGRHAISAAQSAEVDRAVEAILAGQVDVGPPEPPARLHGDLWAGNLLWGEDGRVWLIDPAAHGGHRESDLAMLALFGAPHLARILAAYNDAAPLAEGWRDRVGLHQAWPLLVHAALFGGSYGGSAIRALRSAPGA